MRRRWQPAQSAQRRRRHRSQPHRPGQRGWKWSLFADRNGIPVGWSTDGANRHDTIQLGPTLAAVVQRGLLNECETLHLDRGYDNAVVHRLVASVGIDDLICSRVRPRGTATGKKLVPLGMRWPIERTNSWLSNVGQLRRNTDQRSATASDSSPSRSRCSSPPNSSTGETGGAHDHAYPRGLLGRQLLQKAVRR
jgi:hypothetical protein